MDHEQAGGTCRAMIIPSISDDDLEKHHGSFSSVPKANPACWRRETNGVTVPPVYTQCISL